MQMLDHPQTTPHLSHHIALAVVDSPLARKLIATGEITPTYLETTGPLVESCLVELPGQRFLLHNSVWNWSLAHRAALTQQDVLAVTVRMIERLHVPWLSIHLGFSAEEVVFDGCMKPASALLFREQLFSRLCQHIKALAQALPVPLLIENLDYNPGGAYEYICEPNFITDVLEETNVGLLLDLAHTRVSANRLRVDITDYLDHLPLQRVVQLHISGPRWQDNSLVDVHEPLLDEDYQLLKSILEITTPKALTLEYRKDKAALKQQLFKLAEIVNMVRS